jgi:hypothetical protein
MATYVQFKDGVAHAHVTTDGVLDDPTFREVTCSGHMHLGQVWTGSEWVDAKPIRYAILDDHNTVVQINTTFYASEVQGKILEDDAIQVNWQFNGTSFNPPVDPAAAIQSRAQAEKEAIYLAIQEETARAIAATKALEVDSTHETTTSGSTSPA